MTAGEHEEVLRRLARESGRILGELGVRPEDDRWIGRHAEAISGLVSAAARRSPLARLAGRFYRLARKAARMAR